MPQPDAWKQVARQRGVAGIRKLLGQYRIDLAVPGAPQAFSIKLYETPDGRFEAIASHMLVFAPPKPKTAVPPPRPMAKPLGARPAEPRPEKPVPLPSYASEEDALSQTLQTLIQMSRLKNAAWEPNPAFQ